ncbi:MAG: hypothetical protein ACU84J_03095 [Gammaproteobacteria bacterium]
MSGFIYPEMGQVVVVALMLVIPLCLIYRKAGFHPAWGLLCLLPGFGWLIIFLHLALTPWPNQQSGSEDA